MSLFVSSASAVQQPGVFLIEVAPPTIIDGVSNGLVGLVFNGEWGPVNTLYVPTSGGDMINTYFPAGTPHNSTGYYATMRRKQVPWAMCRILDGSGGLLPPTNLVITQSGTPGAATVTYAVTSVNAAGETMAGATWKTTTANATLNGSNFNVLTWPAVTGATGYSVYRLSGGPSQGKVATAQAGVTYNDQGGAAAGSSPASNGSGYSQAACYLVDASAIAVMQLVTKYPSALPNTVMTATVAAASDGVANHFNLTVSLTDPNTGTSTETYPNCQTIATAILPNVTNSNLLASATLINTPATRPANGSYSFTNGSNGVAITAADYNNGFTQLATRNDIRVVCVDDCGDSIRATVNTNLQAHVDATTNRVAVMHGSATNALAAVITDVANYRDDRVFYMGAWVGVLDDLGNVQQSPFATFVASALINLEPQQSHAWWDDRATQYYSGINGFFNATTINPNDDGTKNQCTLAGVCLPTKLESGKFAALHDRTASTTSGKTFGVTRRIKDYLGLSIKSSIPGWVNGPNSADQQRALKNTINDFLTREQIKGRVSQFQLDSKTPNTASSIALGQYGLIINAITPAPMEKIFIYLNVGPTVTITAQ